MIQVQSYDATKLPMPALETVPQAYREDVADLFATWHNVRGRNKELNDYYRQKNVTKSISSDEITTAVNVENKVGWAKKAVDIMAARSVFDGFVFAGEENLRLNQLVHQNALDSDLFERVKVSALEYGCGAFTVMRGNAGQPDVKVRSWNANQCAMLWDKDDERIACGIVLSDVDRGGKATRYTGFWPDAVLQMELDAVRGTWSCTVEDNPMGRPLMEPLIFEPDDDRPFGRSRITPEVMAITDRAQRHLRDLDVAADNLAFPLRYLLGVDASLLAATVDEDGNEVKPAKTKRQLYFDRILAITRDEDGNVPQIGQLDAADLGNIIQAYEQCACEFSGATNVPLAELGVLSNNYTSSDALNAGHNPLVLDVERMNRRFQLSLENVARMMLAIDAGCTLAELPEEQVNVEAHFRDPSMPTKSSMADASMKLATAVQGYAGTRIFWERNGFPESDIDRLFAEQRSNDAITALNAIADSMQGTQQASQPKLVPPSAASIPAGDDE